MLWAIRFPTGGDRSPHFAEQLLASVRPLLAGRAMTLMIGHYVGRSGLFVQIAPVDAPFVLRQILAAYPDCKAEHIAKGTPQEIQSVELHLAPSVLPLATQGVFEDSLRRELVDPLAALLAALGDGRRVHTSAWLEISVSAADERRIRRAKRFIERVVAPRRWAEWLQRRLLALSDAKGGRAALFRFVLVHGLGRKRANAMQGSDPSRAPMAAAIQKLSGPLFAARVSLRQTGMQREPLALVALRMRGVLSTFTASPLATWTIVKTTRRGHQEILLSPAELATLWHPPTESIGNPGLDRLPYRQLEPPRVLPTPAKHPNVAVLGRAAFRERRETFGLLPEDRRRHLAVIGKTGMGKSTLLASLLVSDMRAGRGVGLVDPHGDLAEQMLACVPRHRTNDVVLFDAGDRAHPVAFNPLACAREEDRPLVASGVVSAFKRQYADSWGPRLEYILRNAVLALVETPETSLASLLRMLSDGRYRRQIAERLHDPVVRAFWQREFESWKPQFQTEAVAPIQNKVGQLLSHPILRAILAQPDSTIDLRGILDEGRIFIANLSKGRIGEDGSALLGSLVVTGLQQAAMSRADMKEEQRQDFHLAVDEFQNFATDSFATILSEARKYRLCLTLANQYLDQVPETIRAAVFGNVGTLLAFQVGAADAEALAVELGGDVTPTDLVGLPKYTAYVRLMIDGHVGRPFSMQTLPLRLPVRTDRATVIRRTSRHRYGRLAIEAQREIATAFFAA